jgi:hypothetical protein
MFMRSKATYSVQNVMLYPKIILKSEDIEKMSIILDWEYVMSVENSLVLKQGLIIKENTHGNGSFPCENCEEIYKPKRALDDHRKRKHLEKIFVCDECGAKFYNTFSAKKHKKFHGMVYPFPCNLCDKICRDKDQLKVHACLNILEKDHTDANNVKQHSAKSML